MADSVATITLNEPSTRNALSAELLGGLIAAFERARDEQEVRCVVLASSHEKVFSSGANLGGFAGDVPLVYKHFGQRAVVGLFKLIGALGEPVICAAQRARACRGAGDRAGVRPDRGVQGARPRSARQEINVGTVPVHDHGFDLPQRSRARRPTSCCCWASSWSSAGGAGGLESSTRWCPRRSSTRLSPSGPPSWPPKSPLIMRLGKEAMRRQLDMPLEGCPRLPARAT